MSEVPVTPDFLSSAEAAQFLGVKPATLIAYCNQGKIRACYFARHWKFQRADLVAFASENRRGKL